MILGKGEEINTILYMKKMFTFWTYGKKDEDIKFQVWIIAVNIILTLIWKSESMFSCVMSGIIQVKYENPYTLCSREQSELGTNNWELVLVGAL